jgi:PAS domain-containing protein
MPLAATLSLVYLLAAAVALAAAAVIWPRRAAPGGMPLTLLLLAAAFWAVCDAIELHVPTVEGRRLVSQFQYIAVVAAAPCFFHAAMALSGRSARLTPSLLIAVWAVPLASLVLAWTNPWHRLVWTDILPPSRELPFATYRHGWWLWVLTVQHYLLMVAATILLVDAIRRVRRPFRPGMAGVLVAVILPWIGNAAYNARMGPWPGLNWLTLSLGISGGVLVWVVLREGLLDVLPSARDALLDKMTDGVMVTDREGRVMIANVAARALALSETTLAQALGLSSLRDAPEQMRTEAQIDSGDGRRWLDVRIDPIRDRWGALAGRLIVTRDVTFEKALDDEREHLIDELRAPPRRVVVNHERLLPICAGCYKVRDDSGNWSHVEEYFRSRAPAEFTHGICPECEQKLYPPIIDE